MLRIKWFGKFEDCFGKFHPQTLYFDGRDYEDVLRQISDYVDDMDDRNDWCLVETKILDTINTRNQEAKMYSVTVKVKLGDQEFEATFYGASYSVLYQDVCKFMQECWLKCNT